MNDVRVSVILPIYNGSAHCEAALSSVLGQAMPAHEVIIVDDGSPDDSIALLEALVDRRPRRDGQPVVTFLHQDNAGQSAARNSAAAKASGDLLAFIDQDDLWSPTHLQRLVAPFARRPEVGWVYSDFDEIDARGSLVSESYIAYHQLPHPKRSMFEILASDLMILPSASVLRAAAFHAVGGFDERLCGYEDDDLFVRMFRAGWRSEFVRQSLTSYRVHEGGASAGHRFLRSRLQFLDNMIATVPDNRRMNRYFVRDLVYPRLFQTTLAEYSTALLNEDFSTASDLARTAAEISERFPPTSRRRRVELALMAQPVRMRQFLQVYERMPRFLRPHINEGFSLRTPGSRPRD